jgi:hypothetical protein
VWLLRPLHLLLVQAHNHLLLPAWLLLLLLLCCCWLVLLLCRSWACP